MTSLPEGTARDFHQRLQKAQDAFAARYPGESSSSQPVHTVYGGAHLFKSDTVKKLGEIALRSLGEYAPEAKTFAEAVGIRAALAEKVYARVQEKLRREAVEDFRIDFEDGYGNRPDSEEDGHARQAAEETAKGLEQGTLPPFVGIRIKAFSAELGPRALRTLDLYLTTLIARTGGRLPPSFVVTLPKGDRHLPRRRRHHHHADRPAQGGEGQAAFAGAGARQPARGACGVAAPRGRPASFAGQRVLSGMGPASRAASQPLRRALRVLPRRPRRRDGAPAQFRREARASYALGRHLRRRGDGAGAAQLLPPRHGLRRAQRGGGAGDGHHARGIARPQLREDRAEPAEGLSVSGCCSSAIASSALARGRWRAGRRSGPPWRARPGRRTGKRPSRRGRSARAPTAPCP